PPHSRPAWWRVTYLHARTASPGLLSGELPANPLFTLAAAVALGSCVGQTTQRARAHPLPGIRAAICAQERTRSLRIVSTTRLSMGAERRIRIRLVMYQGLVRGRILPSPPA